MHIGKTGTDVLLIGSAWAPGKRPVTRMQVAMSVAGRQKTILVTGDRVWRDGQPSDPQPFESMPLVWERAFGGVHRSGDKVLAEERNPVGCGFAGRRSARRHAGPSPFPISRIRRRRFSSSGRVRRPACLAPIAPSWLPRRAFAGTYDERWQRARAPYLPDDFDPRFFQCAAPEFAFDRYLQAGEPVQVAGVMPDGPIAFTVPNSRLSVAVTIAGSTQTPPANLETLSIEPDENRACFTWRAAVPCDRQALKVEKIVVSRSSASVMSARHWRDARPVRDRQRHRSGVGVGARGHRPHRQLARDGSALRADPDGTRAGRRAAATLDAGDRQAPAPLRARRMLRLAAPSFQAVAKDLGGPVPRLHRAAGLDADEAPWLVHVPAYLQKLTGVRSRPRSAAPSCRTAAPPRSWRWSARSTCCRPIRRRRSIVGGVDTYLDLRLLATLDAEQRILGPRVMDGFIPGEGAAFYRLVRRRLQPGQATDHAWS